MPRKSRPLNREDGAYRDASLIIIASEDKFAAKDYFSRFRTKRVQFSVIETEDCRSAPNHVIKRLDDFKKEYVTEDGDSFWLCIDRDRWDEQLLLQVLRDCLDKGHGIAVSNPCFELWILLHYENPPSEGMDRPSHVIGRLKQLHGGYGKKCCRTLEISEAMVRTAMERARALDASGELLPTGNAAQVYKILDALLAKEAIVFS